MKKTHCVLAVLTVLLAAPAAAQSMAGGKLDNGLAAFGNAVAIVETDVLIGEPANTARPGTVYVYRKAGASWREALRLSAADGKPTDGFGAAMAADGNILLVGATAQNDGKGAVYVFERTGTSWQQVARLVTSDGAANDGFGGRLALRGEIAVIGAPNAGRQTGAAYVFRRAGAQWTQVAKLASPEPKEQHVFGGSVAVVEGAVLIGESGAGERMGTVHVFKADASGAWKAAGKLNAANLQRNDRFGSNIAAQGDNLYVSAPNANGNSGTVIAYRKDAAGEWREFRRLYPFEGRNDFFGNAIALDGNQVWVGAPGANSGRGYAYHFWRASGDSLWAGVERFSAANDANDRMGNAIAARGSVAVVGMVGDDFGAGTTVIMELAGNAWKQTALLKTPPEGFASITGKKVECTGKAAQFECDGYDLQSFLSISDIGGARGVRLSGNWGWTDPETGKEYGLIGRVDGTSIVDITNPEKPVYVANVAKTKEAQSSSWREIKTYKNWMLVVSDGSGPHGIQFVDLTRLRAFKGTPLQLEPDHTYRNLASIHNIVVNEEADFAAAVGANGGGETCGGGLHMLNIKDPKNPVFLGCFADRQTGRSSTGYSHDALCLNYRGPDRDYSGKEICLGSNETMLSIADVTDKKAPKAISRAGYPNVGYTHQGWYDAEQRYFYMNDELDEVGGLTPRTRTIIWDLADLDDPQVVGEFLGTTAASDHNLYVIGDLMYQSNYQAGLRVIDIKDRRNPKEVGFFDTVPYGTNGPGFGGSWNNYPFFKSGNIVVSSGAEGIFVVKKKQPKVVS